MYPSNLSDQAWIEIEHFFKRSDPRGPRVFTASIPLGPLEKTLDCGARIRLLRGIQKISQRF